jgi:hypothetical protein
MADVSFDEFYGEIALQASGVPEPLVDRAIVRACRAFCAHSEYWRVTLEPEPVFGGVGELLLPRDSEIVRPLWVRLGDRELIAKSDHSLMDTKPGRARAYVLENATLTLVPVVNGPLTERLVVRVILQPTRNASRVPEAIGDRYYEAIVAGALSYICAQVDQPWGNADLAAIHGSSFNQYVEEARRRAGKEGAHVPRVVSYGGL